MSRRCLGIRTLLGTEVIGGAATRYDSAARAWRVGVRSGGSDAELCWGEEPSRNLLGTF